MSNYEALLSDASQLPIGERIQLIEALWDTVPEGEMPPLSDEWAAEIRRRRGKGAIHLSPGNPRITVGKKIDGPSF